MKLFIDNNRYFDTEEGIDISISLGGEIKDVKAWYVDSPVIEPVRTEQFTGSVAEGGSVNFRNIHFNPHGNGTHTECLGHITKEVFSVNALMKEHIFEALLITVLPQLNNQNDLVISKTMLEKIIGDKKSKALVIRTLPNKDDKYTKDYSSTNPPYLEVECIEVLNNMGVEHLLIDLPSVDKEYDEGELAMHHAFWGLPENPQFHKTITELIYVPNSVEDGKYILLLQIAPFENDASPSKPVLYKIRHC